MPILKYLGISILLILTLGACDKSNDMNPADNTDPNRDQGMPNP